MASANGRTQSHARVPILGEIFAGKPVPVEALPIIGWRSIRPIKGARAGERYAAAPVNGHSMIEDHIIDGDLVIFKLTHEARTGDLIIALTPDGLTLKYFYPQPDGTIILRGANSLCDDQVWQARHLKIQGVVRRIERDL